MTDRRAKLGKSPGTLMHLGERKNRPVEIHIMDYNEKSINEYKIDKVSDLRSFIKPDTVTWINIDGIHDAEKIREIGEIFSLHTLLLEDLMNPEHRPKIEHAENYIFFTLKMLNLNKDGRNIKKEQVSFFLGENWVLSFLEDPGDVFEPVRLRIRSEKGRIRGSKSDYLAYALIDVIVDHYFLIIDSISDRIEVLEWSIFHNEIPDPKTAQKIQALKKDLMLVRKSVIPIRDAVGSLEKGISPLIHTKTTFFLKDVYDHTLYITDSIEVFREMLNSAMEMHLSALSNRLNKVIKVLTIISTIFVPLTFLVGVWGMNFKFMPEIEWKYGYLFAWSTIIITTIGLIIFLRKKKWM
jgi:magnesium transporter